MDRAAGSPILGVVGVVLAAGCATARPQDAAAQPAPTPAAPARATGAAVGDLKGRFYLGARTAGDRQPDMIDFQRGGVCTADVPGRAGLPCKWEEVSGGIFVQIEGAPEALLAGPARLSPYSLHVLQQNGNELVYAPEPKPPHVPLSALLGTRLGTSSAGAAAQELTADGRFRSHNLELFHDGRFYLDVQSDGRFKYEAGVVTYTLEQQENLVHFEYMRDFVVGRDARCVWMVEVVADELVCMAPAATLDLPPPPAGYRPLPR